MYRHYKQGFKHLCIKDQCYKSPELEPNIDIIRCSYNFMSKAYFWNLILNTVRIPVADGCRHKLASENITPDSHIT